MIVKTHISYGYATLIDTFFKANDLNVVVIEDRTGYVSPKHITLEYEDNSDTALSITIMSIRHLGLENMLCDYLIRCGICPGLIGIGKFVEKRSMEELNQQWEEHRKKIGLAG